jgi:Glycosyl hydrolases family 2
MSTSEFELTVGEVTAMEGRVIIQFRPPAEPGAADGPQPITLRGTLRGPYCEKARTLPAEFPFQDLSPARPLTAEAVVPDPCLWSPDLPHLYRADVEAIRGAQVIAGYHGEIGLRSTSPIRVHV